jgi:predicted amidohydrolase YtcJ
VIADAIVVGGSLFTVGMLADLALLDGDIFAAPAEVIAAPRVEQT